MRLSRRDVIKSTVFAGAAMSLPLAKFVSGQSALDARMPASLLPRPFTLPFATPPVAIPYRTDAHTDYYKMWMQAVTAEIIPGFQTPVYAYEGSIPGPTIKARQGRATVVRHFNGLPSQHAELLYEPWTSVHLHGSASLPQFDGYASDITRPGQYKDYHYPNFQPARTLWYHDHGVHHTAENVYMGLAAQYHLTDPTEQTLGLCIDPEPNRLPTDPQWEFDVPLIIADRMFQADGSLLFSLENESGMYGDVILVNGVPWPKMKVKRRKYRFRVLNGSISRSYNWSLSTGDAFTVIATDGGLMPQAQTVRSIRHGMAERYEVIIDFSKYAPGTKINLRNVSPKNNVDYTNTNKIMQFEVVADAFDPRNNGPVPATLDPANRVMALTAADAVRTRQFRLERQNGRWTINGTTWDKIVESNYQFVEADPLMNSVEIWEITNTSGGWFHPTHIHLVDFKILSRNGRAPFAYEKGPKDVVYVGENETVRLAMRFEGCGKYMMHCHNLIHEDHDMMTQFEVIDPDPAHVPDDPLGTPCKDLPEEWDL